MLGLLARGGGGSGDGGVELLRAAAIRRGPVVSRGGSEGTYVYTTEH